MAETKTPSLPAVVIRTSHGFVVFPEASAADMDQGSMVRTAMNLMPGGWLWCAFAATDEQFVGLMQHKDEPPEGATTP